MNIQGKLIIIGGAVDKGSFTETDLDKSAAKNLNFFEEGILKRVIKESKNKELSSYLTTIILDLLISVV